MIYFSIMGDSTSSLVGTVPQGYRVYYDYERMQENAMRYISDAWWAKVISYFKGRLCVNNAYGGSCVAGRHSFSGNSVKRTELLHNGNIAPDVVLVYMGFKDFGRGVPIKGRNFLWKNPIYFEDAYALMLKRIQENYDPVRIICGTLARTYVAQKTVWQFRETLWRTITIPFVLLLRNINVKLPTFPHRKSVLKRLTAYTRHLSDMKNLPEAG